MAYNHVVNGVGGGVGGKLIFLQSHVKVFNTDKTPKSP